MRHFLYLLPLLLLASASFAAASSLDAALKAIVKGYEMADLDYNVNDKELFSNLIHAFVTVPWAVGISLDKGDASILRTIAPTRSVVATKLGAFGLKMHEIEQRLNWYGEFRQWHDMKLRYLTANTVYDALMKEGSSHKDVFIRNYEAANVRYSARDLVLATINGDIDMIKVLLKVKHDRNDYIRFAIDKIHALMRGAEMEALYVWYKTRNPLMFLQVARGWADLGGRMWSKMHHYDMTVQAYWTRAFNPSMQAWIAELKTRDHSSFAREVAARLRRDFPWRRFVVIVHAAYTDNSNGRGYSVRGVDTFQFINVAGGRSVLVGSVSSNSDAWSKWSKTVAANKLALASSTAHHDPVRKSANAKQWNDFIASILQVNGNEASYLATVSYHNGVQQPIVVVSNDDSRMVRRDMECHDCSGDVRRVLAVVLG